MSARLNYCGDTDQLLAEAVARVVRRLRARDALDSFYFDRGWEGGPHVRLHLLPAQPADAALARETLETYVGKYFADHPSPAVPDAEEAYRVNAARLAAAEGRRTFDPHLHPTDTVEFAPYHFDYHSWGTGPVQSAAETHFADSSRIALRMIFDRTGPERRCTAFLGMVVLTLAVLEPNPEAAGRRLRQHLDSCEAIPHTAGTPVRRHALDLWSYASGAGRYPLRGPLLTWLRSMRIFREQLRAARRSGAFVPTGHRSPLAPLAVAASPQTRAIADVLLYAAHVHGNRLAISRATQTRLAGLVARALIELDEATGSPTLTAVGA